MTSSSFLCVCGLLVLIIGAATASSSSPTPTSPTLRVPASNSSPTPTLRVLASNLGWLENVIVDCVNNYVLASDWMAGSIVRVAPDGTVTQHALGGNFKHVLGLTVGRSGLIYMAAITKNGHSGEIVQFYSTTPDKYTTLVSLPTNSPNGLGYHTRTGMLYTSTEGNELPNGGHVYQIDTLNNNTVTQLSTPLWSSDGLFIDQQRDLLYVGQLFNDKIATFDIRNGSQVTEVSLSKSHGFGWLDDFTLNANGTRLIGANWDKNRVVSFATNTTVDDGYQVVLEQINHPTSMKFGCPSGGAFPATSLFITEAGRLLNLTGSARLLEYANYSPQ